MKRLGVKYKETTIAKNAVLADTFISRTRGLMWRDKMDGFDGMLIRPCNSIHTFGMRFAIDVIFLNSKLEVIRVIENLKPWRMTPPYFRASQVLELYAGTIKGMIKQGDQLEITDV